MTLSTAQKIGLALGAGVGVLVFFARSKEARAAMDTVSKAVIRRRSPAGLEQHLQLIRDAALGANISPLLLAAHVLTESAGRADVLRIEVEGVLESTTRRELQAQADNDPVAFLTKYDRGGVAGVRTVSVGLVQLLPETAAGLGHRAGALGLMDPAVNLNFGAKYIAANLRRYGNVVQDSIAAYNAGSVKLAAPRVAETLIADAAANKRSPCAYVNGTRSRAIKAAIAAAGGAFDLADGPKSSASLKDAGKTTYCNRDYVAQVLANAESARSRFPDLDPRFVA